jgi:hypothetical protein
MFHRFQQLIRVCAVDLFATMGTVQLAILPIHITAYDSPSVIYLAPDRQEAVCNFLSDAIEV